MSGIWYITVPEAGTNYVLNPSAEAADNYGLLAGSPSQSASPSASFSPSGSASPSASVSGSPSASQSNSPSASVSRSPSLSASPSASISKSPSVSPSPSPSAGIANVTRVTTYARFGDYCYQVNQNDAYGGFTLTLATLANAAHYVSLYLYDNVTGSIQVSLNGAAWHDMTVIGGRDGGWVRYGVSVIAGFASGSTLLRIRLTTAEPFYVDAVQVEANGYGTTYIDGDRGEFYRWSGLRHGSTSTRSAQERRGGRERNLLDDYAIEVVEGTKRIGMPPVLHNLQNQSLLPGALYQGVKVLPREIELNVHYTVDDAGSDAATWEAFSAKRAQVIDLLKPDLVRGSQPVIIGYAGQGTDEKLYAEFYYNGGLEGFSDLLHVDEKPTVRLLAPDPFWTADDQETAVLDYTDSVANANDAIARLSGQWQALGTLFNGAVDCIAIDKQRNRIYFGGAFTTANGVTVNRVCYWDGTTFRAMGPTPGVDGEVFALAIAPNGDVWVAGSIGTIDGATSNGVGKYNVSTNTWTKHNLSVAAAGYALCIDASGNIYLGGNFINANGNANQDYIIKYNGSAWSALGTGMSTIVYALAVGIDGTTIYVGGDFATGDGVTLNKIGYWNGTTFVAMGAGLNAGGPIAAIIVLKNGQVVAGGKSSTRFQSANGPLSIGLWTGTAWQQVGSTTTPLGGTGNEVWSLFVAEDGTIYAGGTFNTVNDGSLTIQGRVAGFNGYVWFGLDTDYGSSGIRAIMGQKGDLYLGGSNTGAANAAGLTTVTNGGSTVVYPRLTVINGNSSGSCTLYWLENQSSAHRMLFYLAVQAGETVVLDLTQSQKRLVSDWRGVITNNPLQNSDVTNWKLLPGANTIATFITGTVTSVVALLHWTPRYWSADGAA